MADLGRHIAPAANLVIAGAADSDAPELAALHAAVAADLERQYGPGPWSYAPSERAIRSAVRTFRVLTGRLDGTVVATLQLQTRKPWAIDRSYLTPVDRPLYLVSMAVAPDMQRRGLGRVMIDKAIAVARAWPAGSVCLDAYDAEAGAGPFYEKCGFREVGGASYRGTPHIYYEMLL